jgi:hypothetical protein
MAVKRDLASKIEGLEEQLRDNNKYISNHKNSSDDEIVRLNTSTLGMYKVSVKITEQRMVMILKISNELIEQELSILKTQLKSML